VIAMSMVTGKTGISWVLCYSHKNGNAIDWPWDGNRNEMHGNGN